MRLDHIEPSAADTTTGRLAEPVFTLVTRSGTRIAWGYAPGANAVGELAAAEKVARLERYFTDHDTLAGPQGKPQVLDVHDLPPSVRP